MFHIDAADNALLFDISYSVISISFDTHIVDRLCGVGNTILQALLYQQSTVTRFSLVETVYSRPPTLLSCTHLTYNLFYTSTDLWLTAITIHRDFCEFFTFLPFTQ